MREQKPPFSWPGDDDVEGWAKDRIAELEAEFRKRAQPFVDILLRIEARKPPKPIFIPLADLPSHMQESLRDSLIPPQEIAP